MDIDFKNAVKDLEKMNIKFSKEDKCILYGLYNQSLFGDNINPKPSFLDYNGRRKWYSWNRYKGKTKIEAQKQYVNYVKLLKMVNIF